MATNLGPDITSILAALAAQRSAPNPTSHLEPATGHQSRPIGQIPQAPIMLPQNLPPIPGYNPGLASSYTPVNPSGILSTRPVDLSSLNLNFIKPTSSGSVSLPESVGKHRTNYDDNRTQDHRLQSRSSSRTPSRRDSYNPGRSDRHEDPRRGAGPYNTRDRSLSPRRLRDKTPEKNPKLNRSNERDHSCETICIDSHLVGLVIGRQGENLRKIEQDSGARIQFLTGPDSFRLERQCKISGTLWQRNEAKNAIFRTLDENQGYSAKGRASQTNPNGNINQADLNEQMMIPDPTVGLIIGRGGETIRDIQYRSRCHVNILSENLSRNGLRPLNLIGSRQAIDRAKEIINEIVQSDTRAPPASHKNTARERSHPCPSEMNNDCKGQEFFQVASEAVGMIIGRGGEAIKELQAATGCKIKIAPASSGDAERGIYLVGQKQAVENAKRAIMQKVNNMQLSENGSEKPFNFRQDDQDLHEIVNPSSQNFPMVQPITSNASSSIQAPAFTVAGAPGPAPDSSYDPYSIYGGYQNYVAMWTAALHPQVQQQQQQQQHQQPQKSLYPHHYPYQFQNQNMTQPMIPLSPASHNPETGTRQSQESDRP